MKLAGWKSLAYTAFLRGVDVPAIAEYLREMGHDVDDGQVADAVTAAAAANLAERFSARQGRST